MPELIEKQFDPRMHSAEHIVNHTMNRMFRSGRCFSAHIERKKSKLDYYFDRTLTQAEIAELVKQVNEIIQAAREVTGLPVRMAQPKDLQGLVDSLHSPAYSTGIGLLKWGMHDVVARPSKRRRPPIKFNLPIGGWLRNLLPKYT